MLIGSLRVSSDNDRQTTDLQRDALLQAGVDARQLFEDKASGMRDDRPGLAQALAYVRAGDCLVVWTLDRLGHSLPHLLHIVNDLQARGVALRSLTEQMETTTGRWEAAKGWELSSRRASAQPALRASSGFRGPLGGHESPLVPVFLPL